MGMIEEFLPEFVQAKDELMADLEAKGPFSDMMIALTTFAVALSRGDAEGIRATMKECFRCGATPSDVASMAALVSMESANSIIRTLDAAVPDWIEQMPETRCCCCGNE